MIQTPLTDFIASLADPATLDRFRDDPAATAAAAGLSEDLVKLVIAGHPGAIRVRGIQELEHAGLAPIVSDKFAPRETAKVIALPNAKRDAKVKAASRRAPIFPISLPKIPRSAFPIASQEDLVSKVSRLLLRPNPLPTESIKVTRPPKGHKPPHYEP